MKINRFRRLIVLIYAFFMLFTAQAANYYWVGGSGNWSDISHWATTSGGSVKHNVVPSSIDMVFFDANSFTAPNQLVTVNNQSIFCLDMNWEATTNNPTFSAPASYVMNVFGSLLLSANMVFDFQGFVNFLATSNVHTINMSGHRVRQVCKFAGLGGAWTLSGPLQIDSTLSIQAGSLNTNSQNITCRRLFVIPSSSVSLDLGNSQITVTGVAFGRNNFSKLDTAVVEFILNNLQIIPGNSRIELNSNKPLMRARGSGSLNLGTILFSNTQGQGKVENLTGGIIRLLRLEMRNDSEVQGAVSFDELVFGSGKNFIFQAGLSYPLKKLSAFGQCNQSIQLFSSVSGTQVTFESSADSIVGNFVSLKDIRGIGGAHFVVRNATDLGNNTGWTFIPKGTSNLYWIGGSGNWNDPMHWSASSGGTGGACVPTAGDNVFFDANSGNSITVTINVEKAFCRSMTWTMVSGNPALIGTSNQSIHIFGSLAFTSNLRQNFQGDFYFEGENQGNTISSAGRIFNKDFYVNGSGSWSLLDSLSIFNFFHFVQGDFSTANQRVISRHLHSRQALPRRLSLGNSLWILRNRDPQNNLVLDWNLNPNQLALSAGQSTIRFSNWYGSMTAEPPGPVLNYNVVEFAGGDGYLYNNRPQKQRFDTIASVSSLWNQGSNSANVVIMQNENYAFQLNQQDTFTLGELIVPDRCTGMIELRAVANGGRAFLKTTQSLLTRRLMIQDISRIGTGTAIANNSIDLGNNLGWTFNEPTGRNLYWVGKNTSSDWFDPISWSLSSGGPGGACIPTALDNVFFDGNSFNGPNQSVYTRNKYAYFRNMTWNGVSYNPLFQAWVLYAFGSVDLPGIRDARSLISELNLRGKLLDNTLRSRGFHVSSINVEGNGSWILQDSLSTTSLTIRSGEFNSNNQPVRAGNIWIGYQTFNVQKVKMGNSHWRIYNNGNQFSPSLYVGGNANIDPGMSLIELTNTNPYFYFEQNTQLHNVLFSNFAGTSTFSAFKNILAPGNNPRPYGFNRIEIRNNGIVLGKNVIDSLIFTAGKTYDLDANLPQTIHAYFQAFGNNCNPIELRSTVRGKKAEVIMNGGRVLADFVQMRDQRGVGSTSFFAGANSTNIASSNERWIFDAPVDYVEQGILGKDLVLCKNNAAILSANTFSLGETYRWSDGSIASTLRVNRGGTYFVAVTYGNGCVLKDTLLVIPAADFAPKLIADTTLCANSNLILNANIKLAGVTYSWQDGSTSSSIKVTQAGQYKVTAELSGCRAADSTQIQIINLSALNLGRDTSICSRQSLLLDVTKSGGRSYLWSNGTTSSKQEVNRSGLYWVEIKDGQCTARDSIKVQVLPAINLNLGRDTSFCDGATYTLRSNLNNASYRWQDGSRNATFTAANAGMYWVEATIGACTERDTVNLSIKELPRFELGGDTSLCVGSNLKLSPLLNVTGNPTYQWSTGSTQSSINVQSTGIYTLTVTLSGCSFRDQKQFTFNPLPLFDLGPNRSFCIGENYQPTVITNGGSYRWNTGVTASSITVTQTGLYYLDVTQNGCTTRDSVFYTFSPKPQVTLGRDTSLCKGRALNLGISTNNASYRWNNGNTTSSRIITQNETVWAEVTVNGCSKRDSIRVQFIDLPSGFLGRDTVLCAGQIRSYQINVPGTTLRWQDNSSTNPYAISRAGLYILQLSSGGCSVRDSVRITYKPNPVFSLGSDTTLCHNQRLSVNPGIIGATYLWNDRQRNIPRQLSQTGTYWLEADLNGCVRRDTIKLIMLNLPQVFLGKDTSLCTGQSLLLRVKSLNAKLQWQDGSLNSTFLVTGEGTYWAQLSLGSCQTRDSVNIKYIPLPQFNLGKDTILCAGEKLTLTVPSSVQGIRWSTSATNPSISVDRAGTYWVQVRNQQCSFRDSIAVGVLPLPQVSLGPDTLLCPNKPLLIRSIGTENAQLLWSDGSTGKSISIIREGTYWVRASRGRCSSSDTLLLTKGKCNVFKAYTPNAFSPNRNNINETFRPFIDEDIQVIHYELQIFDRWGSQVFHSNDINTGWDGRIRGQDAAQGVYIYWFRIEYVDDTGAGNQLLRGTVNLLR